MSVIPGQEDPHLPFDRDPRGLSCFFLDGSHSFINFNAANQFKIAWNALDHPNLVAINLFLNQRYGIVDKDKVSRWKNYKVMVHTNDDEFTHYWMDDVTFQINWGNSVDIPVDAHDYPMIPRDPAVTHDQELAADQENVWTG